jgi:TrmH family RNA methyltransferase
MEDGRGRDGDRSGRPETPPLSNPGSDRVRAVRRLSGRSARRREARFVAEGPQCVTEAVTAHVEAVGAGRPPVVLALYATADAAQRYAPVLDRAADAGCVVRLATPDVLAAMGDTVTSQGLVAVCAFVDVPLERLVASSPRLVAVLAHVRDPGNAGTVVRAADAAGAGGVVVTDASVDVFNPKCVRASAGSLFHLPVATGVPLADTLEALRGAGLGVLAADVAGTVDLDDLQDSAERGEGPLAAPVAWVFGNEAWGLPDDALAAADAVVRVPVYGRAESLNLATAATVCLYASARADRALPQGKQGKPGRAAAG